MIKAVIFDLDSTLASAKELGADFLKPVFRAIRRSNNSQLPAEVLEEALSQCWVHPFDAVVEKYGFTDEMFTAGWNAFSQLEVGGSMSGYGDLDVLAELPVLRFLVTSGFHRLQASKIMALGIEHLFAKIYIDKLEDPNRKGKQRIFEILLQTENVSTKEALVVGDNPISEIAAGNRLNIRTVQILRPGVTRGNNATYYVRDLRELQSLLQELNSDGSVITVGK